MNARNGLSDLIEIWMTACFQKAIGKKDDSRKPSQIRRQAKSKVVKTTKSRQP